MNQQYSQLYNSNSSAIPNSIINKTDTHEINGNTKINMRRLVDKIQNQSDGYQEKKIRWQEIDEKIKSIEDNIIQELGQDEEKEQKVQNSLRELEEEIEETRIELKQVDIQTEEQLVKMNNELSQDLKELRTEQKGVDEDTIKGLDEKYKENIQLVEENQQEYQQALGENQDLLVEQINQMEQALSLESQQRHQSYQQMQSNIQGHLQNLMSKLTQQVRLNEETNTKIITMLNASTQQLQQELKCESADREHTVDTMLSLLENAVHKIDNKNTHV